MKDKGKERPAETIDRPVDSGQGNTDRPGASGAPGRGTGPYGNIRHLASDPNDNPQR